MIEIWLYKFPSDPIFVQDFMHAKNMVLYYFTYFYPKNFYFTIAIFKFYVIFFYNLQFLLYNLF